MQDTNDIKRTLSISDCNDIHANLENIKAELEEIKRKLAQIDTAFLRDDLAGIDYPGHRREHLDRRAADIIISEYKVSATKIVIGLLVTFVVGLLASGFVSKLIAATGVA